MAGNDDLAALREQTALASAAAASVSDLDFAYQLQLAEAIQASLLLDAGSSNPSSSSKGKAPIASSSAASSSSQPAPAPAPPQPSDASIALAVHAADLARAEEDHRFANACRVYHARAAASACVAAHDAAFARELARVPEDRWAHDGDNIERPLDLRATKPLFRVLFKGMTSKEVVKPRDRDPGLAVLAVALCDSRGEVVLRIQKPVEGFAGGRMMLELMALTEGLQAAVGLGIQSLTIVTDYRALHNHMLGIWRPQQKKLVDMIDQVESVQKKFKQCEISLVERGTIDYVMKLARESLISQIAKAVAVTASKEKRETCAICLEDTDVSKIHAVEGCAHRFCFCCMKEHVKVKLLDGTLPACPQEGCTTKLTLEGSKIFLSPRLLDIMVQHIREGQIHPTQKIYCPYPKCSFLMSLSEMKQPMQESSSRHTVADAATLRKCGKCYRSFCINCKVPWHDRMTCYDYKIRYPQARPEDAKLQNLARQQLWRQCIKCKHMIELAEGCYHMTCVCGYEFCYTCGKEWKDKKATCTCALWDEHNIIRDDMDEEEDDDDDYDSEDDDDEYYAGQGHYYGRANVHHHGVGAQNFYGNNNPARHQGGGGAQIYRNNNPGHHQGGGGAQIYGNNNPGRHQGGGGGARVFYNYNN
ncbi:E3 ubiquitin-protein ligase RSL1-like [Lolium rigidum]|uniref:E3 ubiquitin-protein ligase RSL1-like n=1 Tax=Lolium rigidum TaxID=89674 RepID=UPI001F5C15B2|nr:E3 ubiquitin-protein ligase RSL1-like [Lolium rigidum]